MELLTSGALDIVIIVQKIRLVILFITYKLKNLHMQIIRILFFFRKNIIKRKKIVVI